jgi:hypothetical protein
MASFSPWDLVPGVAAVRHAGDIGGLAKTGTNALGITTDPKSLPNPANSVDAQRTRTLADAYQSMSGRPGGVEQTVTPTQLDQTQANQARGIATNNINDLQGVANGTTRTAADELLTRGTDAASRGAMGLAAAYSRSNPGEALRQALAAQGAAVNTGAGAAAQQKLQEQEDARNRIGALADTMRTTDIGAAGANQTAGMEAQRANQAAGLQQQGINNQFQLGAGQLAAGLTTAPLTAQEAWAREVQAQNDANQKGTGSVLTTLGALSDKRAKKNVRTANLADALAKNVRGVRFEYRDDSGEKPGAQSGILADDLEKVIPEAIAHDRKGMKRVDTAQVTMSNTGTIAELGRRLKKLEKRAA